MKEGRKEGLRRMGCEGRKEGRKEGMMDEKMDGRRIET